jgi:phage baseplate assembly protein gpV
MLDNVSQIEPHDYDGIVFIGTVVDNNDPQKLERVRVTIPNLFQGDTSTLPWCAPKYGRLLASNGGAGSFGVPSIGSTVFVILQQGDPKFPLYVGMPVNSSGRPAEASANYPNRYGFHDEVGNIWYIDKTNGSHIMQFTHASGSFSMTVANNGACTVNANNGLTINGPVTHNGDMTHNGNTSQNGNYSLTGTLTANGQIKSLSDVVAITVSLHGHRHNAVKAGSDNSGPPNP